MRLEHRDAGEREHNSVAQRPGFSKGLCGQHRRIEQCQTRPHLDLAELQIGDRWLSRGSWRYRIWIRATLLGAHAVCLRNPDSNDAHSH